MRDEQQSLLFANSGWCAISHTLFGVGFFLGRPHLMVVPAEVGEAEIAKCKLIPEKNSRAPGEPQKHDAATGKRFGPDQLARGLRFAERGGREIVQ